jgi:DNA-binding CsgD family transcriptional regulator
VLEERAYRVRRDIAALASSGLGVRDLHSAAIRLIDGTVRTDMTCWAALDPETLAVSGFTGTQIAPEYERWLIEGEYSANQPHTFATLALRKQPIAKLSDLPDRDRNRSVRYNEVWRPMGVNQELRLPFLADTACWGAAGMVRAGRDFTDRETDFLVAVAPAIASATRLAVRAELLRLMPGGHPAIVVVDPRGELQAATPAAKEWQQGLDQIAPGRFLLMMQVMASGARTAPSNSFRARLQHAPGQWAVLESSPLIGGDEDQVAVTIEAANGDQLIGLLLVAYGLTPREREICREIIAGHSTSDIAARLFISANTVQDHLKSMFAKVGVRSRGELVARLRPNGAISERAIQPSM